QLLDGPAAMQVAHAGRDRRDRLVQPRCFLFADHFDFIEAFFGLLIGQRIADEAIGAGGAGRRDLGGDIRGTSGRTGWCRQDGTLPSVGPPVREPGPRSDVSTRCGFRLNVTVRPEPCKMGGNSASPLAERSNTAYPDCELPVPASLPGSL